MDYVVRTEVFEGPFDLLLHLIARQRVDLWQVSLSRITEDYLAEIRRMRQLNLEVATEFLLVARLLQYRAYKQVAGLLGARFAGQAAYVPRRVGAEDSLRQIAPNLLVGVEPPELARLAAAALTPAPAPDVTTAHIAPPKLSVAEAVAELAARLRERRTSSFEELVGRQALPIEVVIGFLALLELYKRSLVDIEQTATFGEIAVSWTGGDELEPADIM